MKFLIAATFVDLTNVECSKIAHWSVAQMNWEVLLEIMADCVLYLKWAETLKSTTMLPTMSKCLTSAHLAP